MTLPAPRSVRLYALPFLAVATLAVLAACGGGDKPTAPPVPTLASLTFDGKLDTLSELSNRQLSVSGIDTKGVKTAVGTVTWQSSDTTVATVSTDGLVTAVQPGATTLTVRSGTVTASFQLRVIAVPVGDITVRIAGGVAADTLMVGTSATLVAEARDVGGRPLLGRAIALSSGDPARATVENGRLSGLTVGYVDIVARVDTVERRRTLVVRPTYAAKMAIRLADPKKLGDTTWVGLRDTASVTFSDSAGQALAPSPFRPVSFSSDNPAVATVEATGAVRLVGPGTATIRANGEKLVGAKQIVAVRAPVVSILSAPDTVRVQAGGTTQIRPILVDGAGLLATSLSGHSLRFEAATPSVATVDDQGVVHGGTAGLGAVKVTSDRGTATVPVKVSGAASADEAFHITLRFRGPQPAPYVVDAFNAAVTRWENVIRRTTGTYTDTLTKGDCGVTEPTHEEVIKDVIIYATIDSIDGPSKILGQAGPCYIKQLASGRWMSSVGEMQFDSADMNLMQKQGLLVNVITHEMGHVLGIGTMWSSRYNNNVALANQRGGDPRYFGTGGIGASVAMGFTGLTSISAAGNPLLENVPLEDTGGSGTAGSHWRRSVYGNELMNGWAAAGAQPLSLLTLMAMADLGYSVNTGAAETWGQYLIAAPNANLGRLREILGAPAVPIGEALLAPRKSQDRSGRSHRLTPQ